MRSVIIALVLLVLVLLVFVQAQEARAPFSFVALGDMPYGSPEEAYPPYEALIQAINAVSPDFSIHVGDIKAGSTPCTDEEFQNQLDFFNTFASALVYTPGDNEWTDCHREAAGAFVPTERLATLREMFFAKAETLGQKPFALERQSDLMTDYKMYVENTRFLHNGVLFVQVHIVGSNNNFEIRDEAAVKEFLARDAANIAWLNDSFDKAEAENVAAVVVSMQADVFDSAAYYADFPRHSGFLESVGNTLLPRAEAFGKPVLLIHGDSHIFKVDQPFTNADDTVIHNLTRLEVFGETDFNAVRVTVDPEAANGSVFGFQPLYGSAPLTAAQ
jgi:hypothetical protein